MPLRLPCRPSSGPLRLALPTWQPAEGVVSPPQKTNNKLKLFSFIIKLPMRVIPISILNKIFLNLLFANN
ncbi:hypothetical protein [Klebsiella quasipneumoniae]|uniref:hypothetical protein n=1 Tax=Klebsiella quasipneumoniae TaxID=1463165 RepID=UPI0037C14B2B